MRVVLVAKVTYELELDSDGLDNCGNYYDDILDAVDNTDPDEVISAFRFNPCVAESESWTVVVFNDDRELILEGSTE